MTSATTTKATTQATTQSSTPTKPQPTRGTPQASGTGRELQLVTFEVAGEEYAVDILAVQEINRMMELTRVPQSPPEVEGVINLRGQIIPVLDLRKRFGMPVNERNENNRIVVVEVRKKMIGLIVDRVHEVRRIDESIVEPAPAMVCSVRSDFIAGVGKLEDRLIIMLDLPKLFDENMLGESKAN